MGRYAEYQAGWVKKNPLKTRVYTLIRGSGVRARQRGLPHELDAAWLEPILERGICQATGMPFDMVGKATAFVPSIDRVDPSLGYTKANSQVVILIHNSARGRWGDKPLREYLYWMTHGYGKPGTNHNPP